MTDITPENVARICTALRDWEQFDEGVINDRRESAADMLEALSARVAELGAAFNAKQDECEEWKRCAADRWDAVTAAEAQLAARDAENAKLREALLHIDAIDPEHLIDGCAPAAIRGFVLRMGEIARAALQGESSEKA
jgi:hypothetical protein